MIAPIVISALLLSTAFAVPVDTDYLNKLVDGAAKEIAKAEAKPFDEIGITGLKNLHRTTCKFTDATHYDCLLEVKEGELITKSGEHHKVHITIPLTTILDQQGHVIKFQVNEVDVQVFEDKSFEDGLFKHFWKKVKKSVKKAVDVAKHIIEDQAKKVIKEKGLDIISHIIG